MKNESKFYSASAGRLPRLAATASSLVFSVCSISLLGCGTDKPEPGCNEVGAGCECEVTADCPGGFTFQESCNALGVCVELSGDTGVIDVTDTSDTTTEDTAPDVVPEEVTPDVPPEETGVDAVSDADVVEDIADVTIDEPDTVEVSPDIDTTPDVVAPNVVNNPWLAFIALPDGIDQLYIVRADGSGRQQIDTGDLIYFDPSWSPDGQRLAFAVVTASGRVIRIFDLATGRIVTVDPELNSFSGLTWSPDGTRLAMEGRIGDSGTNDLFIVNVESGERQQVTDTAWSEATPFWVQPNTLYYQSNESTFVEGGEVALLELDLYRYDFSDNSTEQITFGMGIVGSPQVTWDEKYVIFNRTISTTAVEMVRYTLENGAFEAMGQPSTRNPAMSPDGTWVAAVEDVGDTRDIVTYDIATLTRTSVVRDDGDLSGQELTERSISVGPIESDTLPYPPED